MKNLLAIVLAVFLSSCSLLGPATEVVRTHHVESLSSEFVVSYVDNSRSRAYELTRSIHAMQRYLESDREIRFGELPDFLRQNLDWGQMEDLDMYHAVRFIRWAEAYIEQSSALVRDTPIWPQWFLEFVRSEAFNRT